MKNNNGNDINIEYSIKNLAFPLNITNEIVDELLSSKNKDNAKKQKTGLEMMYS